MSNLEQLSELLGAKEAAEVLRLLENYDKYVGTLKKKVNKLLLKSGHEVKVGLAFTPLTDTTTEGTHDSID